MAVTTRYLLDKGANSDVRDTEGRTLLHCAVKENHLAVVKVLCERVTNVLLVGNEGVSALQYAAFCGNVPMTKALIQAGADIEQVRTKEGNTPEGASCSLGSTPHYGAIDSGQSSTMV